MKVVWGRFKFEFIPMMTNSADDSVKNLFTLEHNRRREMLEVFKDEMVKRVQRHELDYGSIEAKC